MQKTKLEKIAGNLSTEIGTTYLATIFASAIPIAVLLPVLTNTLANQRFHKRIEQTLTDVNSTLREFEEKIAQVNDAKFKVISECVLAIFQTTDQKKLNYLKLAITNTILTNENLNDGVFLSRTIRDISAEEVNFLVNNFHYKKIQIGPSTSDKPENILMVASNSNEELVCSGLISLGLMIPSGVSYRGLYSEYVFSSIVVKLLVLLKD